jgi:nitrile hydratase subunit alpha
VTSDNLNHGDGHSPDEAMTHRHPPRPDLDDTLTYYRAMETALRELLVDKGVFTADDIRKQVEDMDNRSPAQGARVVAKAWHDSKFRSLLLSDGGEACVVAGLDRGPYRLVVVENTCDTHNVIVCTLCSCYPRWLLGLPPDWYKSRAYRSRMVREPRSVLREFGTEIPDDVTVRVHDSTADMRYLVLPQRPAGTEGWDEERLAQLVTRDSMIGVSLPRRP